MARDLTSEVVRLANELKQIKRGQRYAHGGSIEDSALEVKDSAGTVRAVIGVQPDGTVGLVAHNGPPPGAPSAPLVTPSIAGLRIVWDGALADGSDLPADFDHIAVHVSTTAGFTPSAATFVGTITRAGDGGILPVTPLPYEPHHVLFLAVNSSGVAGPPSVEVSGTPVQVDGPDLTAGSVTAGTIAAGAVTADKLEAILQLVTRLVAGDPAGARVELNEDGLRVYNESGELVIRFDAADGSGVFTGEITGSTITGGMIQTATSGERITLNELNSNMAIVYDSTGKAVGEFSHRGLRLKGDSGALLFLDPDATYPQVALWNATNNNRSIMQVVEPVAGDANLEILGGKFTGSGYNDMRWRTYMGRDFTLMERLRGDDPSHKRIGGRLYLGAEYANLGYVNDDDATQTTTIAIYPAYAALLGGRLQVFPPASNNSGIYVEANSAHTGALLRLTRETEKFAVDKDGNTYVAGRVRPLTGETGTVTLQSGWTDYDAVNYGTARVRKTADGQAYLIGMIKAGTVTNGTLVATIPAAYWPVDRHAFPRRSNQSNVDVTMILSPNGELRIWDITGTLSSLTFAGMTWPLF